MKHFAAAILTTFFLCHLVSGQTSPDDCFEWGVADPGIRLNPSMVFDSHRRVIVLFGGSASKDTFEWGGSAWKRASTTGPVPRRRQQMVFDEQRRVTVLFGGQNYQTNVLLADLWEWDGESWREKVAPGPSPSSMHVMAYDKDRHVSVLYDGASGFLWEWNGFQWRRRTESGPATLNPSAMAYDRESAATLLWGRNTQGQFQTWTWNGVQWLLRGSGPAGSSGVMAFYPAINAIALLTSDGPPLRHGFWLWDGQAWKAPASAPPFSNSGPALVLDEAKGHLLVYGGSSRGLWRWDGQWAQVEESLIWARMGSAVAFDKARRKLVIFGGIDTRSHEMLGDTWAWDLAQNRVELRDREGPVPRFGHKLVYDDHNKRVLLFGGTPLTSLEALNDLWEWNGERWQQIDVEGPSPRTEHVFAFDSIRRTAILFGGVHGNTLLGDTWEFKDGQWTRRATSGPAARDRAAMSFDSSRGVAVLFGGAASRTSSQAYHDTWEWDGNSWRIVSLTGPSERYSHAMAYDDTRHVIVMQGEALFDAERPTTCAAIGNNCNDTWEWDGTVWRRIEDIQIPPQAGHELAFDATTGLFVLFGGTMESLQIAFLSNCAPDFDLDSVPDEQDECADSETSGLVTIRSCTSDVANSLVEDGCTINDLIIDCDEESSNDFSFRRCVRTSARGWFEGGIITHGDVRDIMRCTWRPSRRSRLSTEYK